METLLQAAIIATILMIVYNIVKTPAKTLLKDEIEHRNVTVMHGASLFFNTFGCRAIFILNQFHNDGETLKVVIRVDFEIYDNTKDCSGTLVWTNDTYIKKEICRIFSPGNRVFYVAYAKYKPKNDAIEVSLELDYPKN